MNDDTFIRVADRVKERGFTVTTYLGQVGRTVPDEANRAQDISHIIRAVQRADYVGTSQLRTMGYKKGDAGTDWFAIATVEPHLLHSQKFHVSGRENYMKAASRIIHLLEEAGFTVRSRRAKASPRSPA